jgi:hypothetical protein
MMYYCRLIEIEALLTVNHPWDMVMINHYLGIVDVDT